MARDFLSVLAIFKNEADNLAEWIEHYLWQGVDRIYLIDNGSTDGRLRVLRPYVASGRVRVLWRPARHMQAEHYNEAFELFRLRQRTRWLAVVDLDEFLYGVPPGEMGEGKQEQERLAPARYDCAAHTLRARLEALEATAPAAAAVYCHWRMFGSRDDPRHPFGSVRTSFVWREARLHELVKGVVRADRVRRLGIHAHDVDGEDARGEDARIRLNHYAIQSRDFFERVKMTRGDSYTASSDGIRDAAYFAVYDNREVHDTLLARQWLACVRPHDSLWSFTSSSPSSSSPAAAPLPHPVRPAAL
jgi:Glycosyltransferase family 92